jgi:hypothetical protein
MLTDFAAVLKSESFLLQVKSIIEENPMESVVQQEKEAQVMLLEMCLDEIANSKMLKIETRAALLAQKPARKGCHMMPCIYLK